MSYSPVSVKVWGDFAAFVRPELKAERVSYEMITPSAARGVLEAIFWKPEFRWLIREIQVLHPMPSMYPTALTADIGAVGSAGNDRRQDTTFYRFYSIMRNEVDRRATEVPILITESRTQRHSLVLRDVAYVIYADVEVKAGVGEDAAKYRDQFQRRVRKGQCHFRPYLGCREFSCHFSPLDGSEERTRFRHNTPINLGLMLFDVLHHPDGTSAPRFFDAQLIDGRLTVDPELYGGPSDDLAAA